MFAVFPSYFVTTVSAFEAIIKPFNNNKSLTTLMFKTCYATVEYFFNSAMLYLMVTPFAITVVVDFPWKFVNLYTHLR